MDYVPNNFKSLSELFDCTLADLKDSISLWDDFVIKITRLHAAIRGVIQANSSFLESFQKIADIATNSSAYASKDIGTSLTRLSLRQRSLHVKMKTMNENIACRIIDPIHQRLDEWKRSNLQLDKDRIKETRRAKNELRKASDEKNRLQKKALKRGSMKGLGSLQLQVEMALKEAADKYQALENIEYDCVRRVIIEERSRFCYFVNCLMPALECQISMFSEMQSLEEIKENLTTLVENSNSLTQSSEDLIRSIMKPLSLSSMDAVVAASIAYNTTQQPLTETGSSEGSLISSGKSSALSITSEASSHSGGANNILMHRRSRSESPSNILHEQESDVIFFNDNNCGKADIESVPSIDPANNNQVNNLNFKTVNGEITNIREHESLTLKKLQGSKRPPCTDESLKGSNLVFKSDTPGANANYSALYQIHNPILHLSPGRKLSASFNRNGEIYPDYHTIHSSSPSTQQPRRMTVPELPKGSYQASGYATVKHPPNMNSLQRPGVSQLDQIDECHLPPNPNEESLMNISLNSTDSDMPMPPPPVYLMESRICSNNLVQDNSSVVGKNLIVSVPIAQPLAPAQTLVPAPAPVPPPPPCSPPPVSLIKSPLKSYQYNALSISQSPQHCISNAFPNSPSPSSVAQSTPIMFSNVSSRSPINLPSSDSSPMIQIPNNINRPVASNVPPPPAPPPPPPPPPPPVPKQQIFPARR